MLNLLTRLLPSHQLKHHPFLTKKWMVLQITLHRLYPSIWDTHLPDKFSNRKFASLNDFIDASHSGIKPFLLTNVERYIKPDELPQLILQVTADVSSQTFSLELLGADIDPNCSRPQQFNTVPLTAALFEAYVLSLLSTYDASDCATTCHKCASYIGRSYSNEDHKSTYTHCAIYPFRDYDDFEICSDFTRKLK